MGEFSYLAKDDLGVRKEGTVAAASRYDALAQLRSRGLTVIDLTSDSSVPAPPPVPERPAKGSREKRGKQGEPSSPRPQRKPFSLGGG